MRNDALGGMLHRSTHVLDRATTPDLVLRLDDADASAQDGTHSMSTKDYTTINDWQHGIAYIGHTGRLWTPNIIA
jgi:hypothetical protein